MVSKRPKRQRAEKWGMKCSDVQWSEVKWIKLMILGEFFVLSLIYSYVVPCRCSVVSYLIISWFFCYFLINRKKVLYYFLYWFCLVICCEFCVFPFLCIALCIVSPLALSHSYSLQVHRPLPSGSNTIGIESITTWHIVRRWRSGKKCFEKAYNSIKALSWRKKVKV